MLDKHVRLTKWEIKTIECEVRHIQRKGKKLVYQTIHNWISYCKMEQPIGQEY